MSGEGAPAWHSVANATRWTKRVRRTHVQLGAYEEPIADCDSSRDRHATFYDVNVHHTNTVLVLVLLPFLFSCPVFDHCSMKMLPVHAAG